MKLQELKSHYCFHDSTLESLVINRSSKTITVLIDDYSYSEDLQITDYRKCLKLVFNDCSNEENLPEQVHEEEIYNIEVFQRKLHDTLHA